ncbi:MAG TPA: hypothetical protein VNU95_14120 [Candidatus Acidoferrales bacterium]|jgi:hypothetical protein|nr:hypothetical protein [Candidatus Acidoferrales bacterium]
MKVIMAFLFLGLLLSACSRHAINTQQLQQQIIGTWINGNTNDTMTFNPGGNYSFRWYWNEYQFHSNVFKGQWQIEGNFLITTLMNVTGTEDDETLGFVQRFKITRLDENEFDYEIGTNELPLKEPLAVHLIREK